MSEAPEPPPLTVLSLSLQCHFNPRTHSNEIVALSGLVHESGWSAFLARHLP